MSGFVSLRGEEEHVAVLMFAQQAMFSGRDPVEETQGSLNRQIQANTAVNV